MKNTLKSNYRIVVLGEHEVGKRTLIERFCEKPNKKIVNGVEGNMIKLETVQKTIHFTILYSGHNESYMKNSDAAIMVFDLSRPETLKSLKTRIQDYRFRVGDYPHIILIGVNL